MIALLRGILAETMEGKAIIDVNGVGYLVFASARTLSRCGNQGSEVTLHIETHVREDHIHLFGFIDTDERDWFNRLGSVQGVGGRVALALLSVAEPNLLYEAIAAEDKKVLTQADGVGPKLAARIVNELKDKIPASAFVPSTSKGIASSGGAATGADLSDVVAEAVSALTNLGYDRLAAFRVVRELQEEYTESGALIAAALKKLGQGALV